MVNPTSKFVKLKKNSSRLTPVFVFCGIVPFVAKPLKGRFVVFF